MLARDLLKNSFGILWPQVALRVLVTVLLEDSIVLNCNLDTTRHRCLTVLVINRLAPRAVF